MSKILKEETTGMDVERTSAKKIGIWQRKQNVQLVAASLVSTGVAGVLGQCEEDGKVTDAYILASAPCALT